VDPSATIMLYDVRSLLLHGSITQGNLVSYHVFHHVGLVGSSNRA